MTNNDTRTTITKLMQTQNKIKEAKKDDQEDDDLRRNHCRKQYGRQEHQSVAVYRDVVETKEHRPVGVGQPEPR